ncbi:hypothetical protein [Parapedobacter soli]|uniref:hypothetical protein n=1 Tax=Parapedobacter soli TaxID=416955 RepID=UPI0021C956C1|nr:hypothetical protein [Parapedobacter soli]
MIPFFRNAFNAGFSKKRYQRLLALLDGPYPGALGFRIAETPVFVPGELAEKLVRACEGIVDTLVRPGFSHRSEGAIPPRFRVPGSEGHSDVLCLDFAICLDDAGRLMPQLIELQGFPTILFFQAALARAYRQCYDIPSGFDNYFNGYTEERYVQLLKRLLLGGHPPGNVVLLEVKPHEQKTRMDFYLTEEATGIRPVCISELFREGDTFHYFRDGRKIPIKRIYNRVIADDFEAQKGQLSRYADITATSDVEWVPHPNWFYRISKHTLPSLDSPYVPETHFLGEVGVLPHDLENYVLKPLYSFAGQGVIVDVMEADIAAIRNPMQWILQRKVSYAPAVDTPTGGAFCEVRMIYCWEREAERPVLVNNLVRLSKGKQIGARYNTDMDWVGVGIGFFEQ